MQKEGCWELGAAGRVTWLLEGQHFDFSAPFQVAQAAASSSARWATLPANPARLQSCGSLQETKPSLLLLSLAHKSKVRQSDTSTALTHRGSVPERIAAATMMCFPKASEESSFSTLWYKQNWEPEAKSTRGHYGRHGFSYVIFLLLSTNRGHSFNAESSNILQVTCHKDLVFSMLHSKYCIYIYVYYFRLMLSV